MRRTRTVHKGDIDGLPYEIQVCTTGKMTPEREAYLKIVAEAAIKHMDRKKKPRPSVPPDPGKGEG